ncbi:unnamed protein product [Coregonus sp. 'balchen']|uniref:Uncharacterized protein n=1 Tax=Coregonus suidteri TaxID=861788 RepID=A0AAN8MGD6_9TELE|nr:uncharacterized protein LOC121571425 [Coregonus clupeaformis]CAB1351291.1 unnamed protein product [Coregonus sp. 'balchen']
MDLMVDLKSLGDPIKQFSDYVSGTGTKPDNKIGTKKSTGARRKSIVVSTGARRKSVVVVRRHSIVRRKSVPCAKTCTKQRAVPESWLSAYQADIQRERKLREKKIAERSVRRRSQHFRSQHCLPKSKTNAKRNQKSAKDDSLFGAFQGLSLNVTGGVQSSMASGGDQCKLM